MLPPFGYTLEPILNSNDTLLDEQPGFSLDMVNLVVKEDLKGDMREIVKQTLVQAVVTGGEFLQVIGARGVVMSTQNIGSLN